MDIKKAARRAIGRPGPRLLTVTDAFYLTPNMIRVVFADPDFDGFPTDYKLGNCNLMIPDENLASRPGRQDQHAQLPENPRLNAGPFIWSL